MVFAFITSRDEAIVFQGLQSASFFAKYFKVMLDFWVQKPL